MQQIARDVFHLPLMPRNAVNAYLAGTVLVDTGMRSSAGGITKALAGHEVTAIALTHAHGDHVGSARKLANELGVPVWVGAGDREATESGKAVTRPAFRKPGLSTIAGALANFPCVPVARELQEGDEIGDGFVVLDAPGHSPGHVVFWREADRVLIGGDVFFNMNLLTTAPGLRQPPGAFTVDPARNRESERRLAGLSPAVAGFGHGPVLSTDTTAKLDAFVAKL